MEARFRLAAVEAAYSAHRMRSVEAKGGVEEVTDTDVSKRNGHAGHAKAAQQGKGNERERERESGGGEEREMIGRATAHPSL